MPTTSIRPPTGIVESQPMTFADPLTFHPDEPRFLVTQLVPSLESETQQQPITACDASAAYYIAGTHGGELLIFKSTSLLTRHVLTNECITALHIARVGACVQFYAGTEKGSLYVVYVDAESGECYSKLLLVSQIEDQIVQIASQNDQFAFGSHHGRVFWGVVPPSKPQIVKVFQPAMNQQIQIYAVAFVRQYLVFATRSDMIIYDVQQQKQLLRQPLPTVHTKFAVDGDLLIVASGDQVTLLLFRFQHQNTECSPLALGILKALEYGEFTQTSSNLNEPCDNVTHFCTFADEVEWDGTTVTQINELQKPQANFQKYEKDVFVEEISRFRIQDPPVTIVGICPCGESLAVVALSDPTTVEMTSKAQQAQTDVVQADPWQAYSTASYRYQEVEKTQQLLHFMMLDIFGQEQHGAILPVLPTQPISLTERDPNPILQFKPLSATLLHLPSLCLALPHGSYIMKPATPDDHISWLLANGQYALALSAGLLLRGFAQGDWTNAVPLCQNQARNTDELFDGLPVGHLRPLSLDGEQYLQAMPQCFATNQQGNSSDIVYPRSYGVKSLIQFATSLFLHQGKPNRAQQMLNLLLQENDQIWTTLAMAFGMTPYFKDLVPLLPIPDLGSRISVLALTLAHNFDSFSRVIIKWKNDSDPQSLYAAVKPIQKKLEGHADICAFVSVLSHLTGNYAQALKNLVACADSKEKASQIFQMFADQLIQQGTLEVQHQKDQIHITPAFLQELMVHSDVLFDVNPQLAARLMAKFLTTQSQIQEVFVALLCGVLKKVLGVPLSASLSRQDFGTDSRIPRQHLLNNLVILPEIQPVMEVARPFFEFLHAISQNNEPEILNIFEGASLQNFLLSYAPLVSPQLFKQLLGQLTQFDYRNALFLARRYADLPTLLDFVMKRQEQAADEPAEAQCQIYRLALESILETGQVGQAIQFIRRIQDMHSSNPQQMRIVKQAGMWRHLTKYLCKGRGVYELLDLLSKESIESLEVKEVIDMVDVGEQTEGNEITQQDAELSAVLFRLVNSLKLLQSLQRECAQLVKQDCVVLRSQLVTEAKRALGIAACQCNLCEHKLTADPPIQFSDKIQADKRWGDTIAYSCGHQYHFQCLEKQYEGVRGWACFVCQQRAQ